MNKQLILGIAIGAAAVALIADAPVTSLLYGLLFLACPLMHLFMHHGHGGHGGSQGHHHGGQQQPETSAPQQPPKTGEQP